MNARPCAKHEQPQGNIILSSAASGIMISLAYSQIMPPLTIGICVIVPEENSASMNFPAIAALSFFAKTRFYTHRRLIAAHSLPALLTNRMIRFAHLFASLKISDAEA
jgi:hypothetical protein